MQATAILAVAVGIISVVLCTLPAKAQSPHDRDLPNDPASVYKRVCSFCHDDGQLGAPVIGDRKAWAPVLAKDRELVYDEALGGLGHMPARRERRGYTDEDIKGAVDYLLDSSR